MGHAQTDQRVKGFIDRGVVVVDARQTWIAADVSPERVCAGAILHPGTRLLGARTFIAPGAQVGVEGPATLKDAVLGPGARVDAGYVDGAVLLDGARAGWGAHFRPGTLLEEEASTAHVVGLKHTILLAFVTLGSVINFCDVLMAGGTSRRDHSEVGSGFIHFNYTPWGKHGDKATPSLVGDVPRGVLLRQPRIFLGGAGGMVGPGRIGYGAVTGAGQVLRRDVPAGRLVVQPTPEVDMPLPRPLDAAARRRSNNVQYIAQLVALRTWYRQVRLARVPPSNDDAARVRRLLLEAAIETLNSCIEERLRRLEAFLRERGEDSPVLPAAIEPQAACPLALAPTNDPDDHLKWVQSLPEHNSARLQDWLEEIVLQVANSAAS